MRADKFSVAIAGLAMMFSMAVPVMAAGKTQTLSGQVSDAMCGAKHMMAGKAAECARTCVERAINLAHSARANRREDLVRPESRTRGQSHRN